MKIRPFGKMKSGVPAREITLENKNGMSVSLLSVGAVIRKLLVPAKDGRILDVVTGFDDPASYEDNRFSFGATVGRVANRIQDARFTLNGKTYELTPWKEPGMPSLHSFPDCYSTRAFEVKGKPDGQGKTVTFALHSPDGDQGFPGNLDLEVTYTLTEDNELCLEYRAVSDADTLLNLTNHSYFNLNGHDSGDVLSHRLTVFSDRIPVYGDHLCPTGALESVEGTVFDFRKGKLLKEGMAELEKTPAGGYDLAYELNGGQKADVPTKAARLESRESGIALEVFCDTPSIQLYTGNQLPEMKGKGGAVYRDHAGCCLEPGYFPNAIRTKTLLPPILKAGETRVQRTVYRFTEA